MITPARPRLRATRATGDRGRPPKPLKRRVHVDGHEWSWEFRGGSVLLVRSPDCTSTRKIMLDVLTGMRWHQIERSRHKGYDVRVRPSDVVALIRSGFKTPVKDGSSWWR